MNPVEIMQKAIWRVNFHPDDVQDGTAEECWEQWPEDAERAHDQAQAALTALQAQGYAVVPVEELAELRQRMPWAGGQSPLVCGSGGVIKAPNPASPAPAPSQDPPDRPG